MGATETSKYNMTICGSQEFMATIQLQSIHMCQSHTCVGVIGNNRNTQALHSFSNKYSVPIEDLVSCLVCPHPT